jgi:hypothetical protein
MGLVRGCCRRLRRSGCPPCRAPPAGSPWDLLQVQETGGVGAGDGQREVGLTVGPQSGSWA